MAAAPAARTAPGGSVVGRRAFVRQIMGMPISVHVRAADPDRDDIASGVERVFAHLTKVDAVFSTWRSDSALLRLQHREVDVEQVHPWVAEVGGLCLEAEERTDGLFQAWRRSPASGRVAFDPTGLVKGWGVAGAAAHLEIVPEIAWSTGACGDTICGVGRHMIGVESVWRIGIENPYDPATVGELVSVAQGAVATSGSAARGAHVLDPRTGVPVCRSGSASVVGPDIMWADVWATAAFVDPELVARLLPERDPAYRLIVQ